MRISRKKIESTHLEIFQRDIFNMPERARYEGKPSMDVVVFATELGHFQRQLYEFVYLISRKGSTKEPKTSCAHCSGPEK